MKSKLICFLCSLSLSYLFHSLDPRMVEHLYVPSSRNYVSVRKKIAVINDPKNWCSFNGSTRFNEIKLVSSSCDDESSSNHSQDNTTTSIEVEVSDPIKYCSVQMTNMFRSGLSELFGYDVKKRSRSVASQVPNSSFSCQSVNTLGSHVSKSQRRRQRRRNNKKKKKKMKPVPTQGNKETEFKASLPTITLGWSQMDSNKYKDTKATIAGNVKPYLRDGGLPNKIKICLLNIIRCGIASLPVECVFKLQKNDSILNKFRKGMVDQVEEMLGGNDMNSVPGVNIEGLTILIPASLGFHKDTNNCSIVGMESVIQINCNIPMNNETIVGREDSELWKWLKSNGFKTHFPCSIILYSRKCVSALCSRQSDMEIFAKTDKVKQLLKWALVDRVGSCIDYEARFWNNHAFSSDFHKLSLSESGQADRSFSGTMMKSVACYNKVVSLFVADSF